MHARPSMIELRALTKRYAEGPLRGGAVTALRDLSLSVPRGEVTAVVGPNGAGKSTLFGLILGFLRPSAGELSVDGLSPRRYTRTRGAAYLPDRFSLPAGWTVRGTLRALGRLEGLDATAAGRRAGDLIARFGLEPQADRAARTLSRGQLQRLGLAQTLLVRRDLVVLDEPAQGLDPLWRIRLRETVRGLADDGCTVLLASHDLAEVGRLARRAVLLRDGTLREVLALDRDAAARRYRLRVSRGQAAVAEAFPSAEPAGEGAFTITVADANELSQRLAAALDAGAIIVAVEPRAGLEGRVRRALDADPAGLDDPAGPGDPETTP